MKVADLVEVLLKPKETSTSIWGGVARPSYLAGLMVGAMGGGAGFAVLCRVTRQNAGFFVWTAGFFHAGIILILVSRFLMISPKRYRLFLIRQIAEVFEADVLTTGFSFMLAVDVGICITGLVLLLCNGFNTLISTLPGRNLNWLAYMVLPGGYLIYRFKLWHQKLYGEVEVVVGILTALATTVRNGPFHATTGLTLVGALYIVARGFNNIHDAQKAQSSTRDQAPIRQASDLPSMRIAYELEDGTFNTAHWDGNEVVFANTLKPFGDIVQPVKLNSQTRQMKPRFIDVAQYMSGAFPRPFWPN